MGQRHIVQSPFGRKFNIFKMFVVEWTREQSVERDCV